MAAPWWQRAVFYQIYPRSFADANGDGVGDLEGITSRLDHLEWLGVDALWISPFFPSPMRDFGYDVSDYCEVDPLFGTLADFDALVSGAHSRDIRVMIDWVPAHTSDQHPWFRAARASREDPHRDWYVWRDPGPDDALPNNWRAAFLDKPAWTFDEASGQYYLHSFLAEQPDLNWQHPDVREAMLDTLRFWLDRGVDGFRADVLHNIGKDPRLPDVEEKLARIPHCALNDEPVTHEYLRAIRRVLDAYPGDRAMVGEIFLLSTAQIPAYYGKGDELHMSFNFLPLFAPWESEAWRRHLDETYGSLDPVEAWPTWVLSNHDQKRQRTRYGSDARARAAAVMLLTLRGTPFLYMGEELGLEDAVIPDERRVDPGGRDGCRAPIPWQESSPHGWPGSPWLPWPPDPATHSAETLRRQPDSILHLYHRLLTARRSCEALSLGALRLLPSEDGTLVYERSCGEERRWVVVNFTDAIRSVPLAGELRVEVASEGARAGEPYAGSVMPEQALLLAPGP